MADGWAKIWRQLSESPFWLAEPFTRGQAWVDLILLANHQDGWIRKRGIRVEIKRGEVGWSERTLAERWRWSRGKVRRFLDELKMEQQIEPQKDNVTSCFLIINYERYQGNGTTNKTTDGPQTVPEQEGKEGKKRTRTNTTHSPASRPVLATRPPEVPEKVWTDFLAVRKEKRAPLTETALDGIIREARKANLSLSNALEKCCERGWQGFNAEWLRGNGNGRAETQRDRMQETMEMIREAREKEAKHGTQ